LGWVGGGGGAGCGLGRGTRGEGEGSCMGRRPELCEESDGGVGVCCSATQKGLENGVRKDRNRNGRGLSERQRECGRVCHAPRLPMSRVRVFVRVRDRSRKPSSPVIPTCPTKQCRRERRRRRKSDVEGGRDGGKEGGKDRGRGEEGQKEMGRKRGRRARRFPHRVPLHNWPSRAIHRSNPIIH
jgi:hypothetical protein